MLDRMMRRFNRWFSSAAGTVQVTVVVAAWVVIEQIYPQLDPHGFLVLYVLTVWSGITQNALAYGSAQAAMEATRSADSNEQMLRNSVDIMRAVQAILLRQEARDAQVAANITEMRHYDALDAKDLDEILAWVRDQRGRDEAARNA